MKLLLFYWHVYGIKPMRLFAVTNLFPLFSGSQSTLGPFSHVYANKISTDGEKITLSNLILIETSQKQTMELVVVGSNAIMLGLNSFFISLL